MLIPISDISEPYIVLRVVDKASLEYLELRDSLSRHGQLNGILVRPYEGLYQVVDGLWRYTAGKEAGLANLDCIVKELTDEEVLNIQVQANAIGKETAPAEYARRLRRIQKHKPEMTLVELAHLVCIGTRRIKQFLSLLDLPPATQDSVDRGDIPLTSAHLLARMQSPPLQREYTELAKVMAPAEFKIAAEQAIKYFMECAQKGKLDEHFTNDFKPQPYLRNLKAVLSELNDPCFVGRVLASERCEHLSDAFKAALRWTLNLDKDSVQQQKEAFEKSQRRNFDTLNASDSTSEE